MKKVLSVGLGDRSYMIHIGPGTWDVIREHLEVCPPTGIMVVTDERVEGLYWEKVSQQLSSAEVPFFHRAVPQGEHVKAFGWVEELCKEMAVSGMDRGGLVLALGGGVVGDLAGFAASIYLRGIRFVQLPTTLLAMVDSSVGGKTGINIKEGKNLVGTFYQPEAVYADTSCLATLDERDWYSGLAEAIKIAIGLNAGLFNYLETVIDLSMAGDLDVVRVVAAACESKARVVELDEREGGLRRVLNFGHTLAHAIEASLGYGTLRHGEAVVLGMKAALNLSVQLCGLSPEEHRRAAALIDRIPVPGVTIPPEAASFLSRDKKSMGQLVNAVLISKIGQHRIVPLEDPGVLVEALEMP
jgi:3-dehydroquinate synthase